jgi:hypothetical protein
MRAPCIAQDIVFSGLSKPGEVVHPRRGSKPARDILAVSHVLSAPSSSPHPILGRFRPSAVSRRIRKKKDAAVDQLGHMF